MTRAPLLGVVELVLGVPELVAVVEPEAGPVAGPVAEFTAAELVI